MTIEISCPNCGEDFRARDEAAGKSFRCKVCGTSIRIPLYDEEDESDSFPRSRSRQNSTDQSRKKKQSSSNKSDTLGPAIGLYVVGSMGLLCGIIWTIMVFLSPSGEGWEGPIELNEAERLGHFVGTFIPTFGFIIFNLIVLVGAFSLQTHQHYSIAMFGCVVASIPCCSPCLLLGMPFGIWGLAVLTDEKIKRKFD